jgi:hypothetical protein
MPVPGMPFEIMLDTWESERRRTFTLAAMFAPLSLPRPSSPWHPAQVELKVRPPGADVVLKSSSHESFCRAREEESKRAPTHTRSASQSNHGEELRLESIVWPAVAIVTDDTGAGIQTPFFFSLGGTSFSERRPMERGFTSSLQCVSTSLVEHLVR